MLMGFIGIVGYHARAAYKTRLAASVTLLLLTGVLALG
jgi:hypothetical protein